MLPPAWIIEVIARIGRAPVFQHPDQAAVGNVLGYLVFERVHQTQAIDCGMQEHLVVVENNRSIDPDLKFDTVLFELPGIKAAPRCSGDSLRIGVRSSRGVSAGRDDWQSTTGIPRPPS